MSLNKHIENLKRLSAELSHENRRSLEAVLKAIGEPETFTVTIFLSDPVCGYLGAPPEVPLDLIKNSLCRELAYGLKDRLRLSFAYNSAQAGTEVKARVTLVVNQ